jgi:hypothetical protein
MINQFDTDILTLICESQNILSDLERSKARNHTDQCDYEVKLVISLLKNREKIHRLTQSNFTECSSDILARVIDLDARISCDLNILMNQNRRIGQSINPVLYSPSLRSQLSQEWIPLADSSRWLFEIVAILLAAGTMILFYDYINSYTDGGKIKDIPFDILAIGFLPIIQGAGLTERGRSLVS